MARLAVSHYERTQVESDYACALNLAEAGVNYEYWKISQDPTTADQVSQSNPQGVTYSYGNGTFTVYCTNMDGSTPWSVPSNLYVVCTGTLNGTSRTIKVSSKGFNPPGKYAIYTMNSLSVWNGTAISITGDVGTNNQFDFSGHPGISGDVYFDGPAAGWYNGNNPGGYTQVTEPRALQWNTVDQIANNMFPAASDPPGGLAFLATHNDNAKASPAITSNSITSSVTLVGPGNYYLTTINLSGNKSITLDNTNGPINIWIGPSGGTGTCTFRGGTSAIAPSSDVSKACTIYVATQSGITLAGNQTLDASIYAYNKDAFGNSYGAVVNSGNPTINGQILGNDVNLNGNITVNYYPGVNKPTSFGYYGFNNSWQELNPVNQ